MGEWVSLADTDPQAFEVRLAEATAGDGWVMAGSYMNFTRRLCWGRLQSVVWLDLPLSLILRRVVSRSWRRWRSRELLWGTNRENFFTQLKVWSKDSLRRWALNRRARRPMPWVTECESGVTPLGTAPGRQHPARRRAPERPVPSPGHSPAPERHRSGRSHA